MITSIITCMLISILIYILLSDFDENRHKFYDLIKIIIFIVIVGMFISLMFSSFIGDYHIKTYENGDYIKQYIITDQDTMYKFIRRR